MNSLPNMTGEQCPTCGGHEIFVPGYLVKRPDGSRYFTVARETAHRPSCKELNDDA